MSWINDLQYRWRALRLRQRQEKELSEELQFHLEMETDRLMQEGASPREAERAARIALGGVPGIQEECREAWGTRLLLDIARDLRGALRRLAKEPRFAAVIIASLTIGIGAVAVIFSMVDAVLLRPLPFGQPELIVAFQETTPSGDLFSTSDANLLDFEERCQSLAGIAGILFPQQRPSLRQGGDRIGLSAFTVTPSFFQVLGVKAHLGRTFSREEGKPGSAPRTVVLDHGAWRRLFAADDQIVGQEVDLDGETWTVIGVLPAGFRYGGNSPDVYLPYVPDPTFPRGDHRLDAVARLAPGFDLAQAQAETATVAQRLSEEFPETNTDWGVVLQPVEEFFLGPTVRRSHLILFGAVGLLLLLVCVNVSSLLMARLGDRAREIQLRRVLGASRGRVLAQLLTESMLLSLLGAAGGLLLAFAAVPVVRSLEVPVPRLDEMAVNLRLTGLVAMLSVAVGLLFGLAPAWRLTAAQTAGHLKNSPQGNDTRSNRIRSGLVALEVALATVLAVGAGLLLQSFEALQSVDSGFNPENVLLAQIDLPPERYSESSPPTVNFYHQLLERIEAMPGVQSAAATIVSPFRGPQPSNTVGTEAMLEKSNFVQIQWRSVTPHFFRTFHIPILRGRSFEEAGRPRREVVISSNLASRLWPAEDPIGQKLRWIGPQGPLIEVVGVVAEVQDLELGRTPPLTVYLPQYMMGWPTMTLAIRSALPTESLAGSVRSVVSQLDPLLAAPAISTLEGQRREALAQPLLSLRLMSLFSLIAVLLAAVGIYGLVAYSVSRRRRELGLRAALGARPKELLGLTLRGSVKLLVLGVTAGLLGTLAMAGSLRTLLYDTSPFDLQVLGLVVAILLVVGLIASWFPARQAAHLDPATVLRED